MDPLLSYTLGFGTGLLLGVASGAWYCGNDAKRYRWLRARLTELPSGWALNNEALDEAIDQALARREKGRP